MYLCMLVHIMELYVCVHVYVSVYMSEYVYEHEYEQYVYMHVCNCV